MLGTGKDKDSGGAEEGVVTGDGADGGLLEESLSFEGKDKGILDGEG